MRLALRWRWNDGKRHIPGSVAGAWVIVDNWIHCEGRGEGQQRKWGNRWTARERDILYTVGCFIFYVPTEWSPVPLVQTMRCWGHCTPAVSEEAWNQDECTCISQTLLLSKQRGDVGGDSEKWGQKIFKMHYWNQNTTGNRDFHLDFPDCSAITIKRLADEKLHACILLHKIVYIKIPFSFWNGRYISCIEVNFHSCFLTDNNISTCCCHSAGSVCSYLIRDSATIIKAWSAARPSVGQYLFIYL